MRLMTIMTLLLLTGLPACAGADRASGGMTRQTMTYAGTERGYYLHVPARVAASRARVPLVVSLHGGGGNGRIHAMMTGFTAKAEKEGFIVVYPDGSGGLETSLLTWNATHCCAYAMRNQTDDVGFIRALLDKLATELPIDTSRVYATGLSNGGMMAHRLGIELSDRIAAIAPVISSLFGDEPPPSAPVPAIIINGGMDTRIQVEGGEVAVRFSDASDAPTLPVAAQGDFWARANGCAATPRLEQSGAHVKRWRYNCPAGQDVERYLVMDGGHSWPGGKQARKQADAPSQSLDATAVIWEFFQEKRR